MKMENLKTILLLNLVVISVFLTYNLWTYQPDSNAAQNEKYIQDIPSVTKKELAAIIFPAKMIIHRENKHFVSEQALRINPIYRILEQGKFEEFKDVSYKVPKGEFLSFVHANNQVELVFPTEIPLETLRGMFSIKDKHLEAYTFDRILVQVADKQEKEDEVQAFFVSYNSRRVYSMLLKGISVKDLEAVSKEFTGQTDEYFMYPIQETKALFLPEKNVNVKKMFYVTSDLEEGLFQNLLFTDPRYVKKDETENGKMYTDGTRLLQISKHTQMLQYENSSVPIQKNIVGSSLIQKSIDFMDNHGGWTDAYRLDQVHVESGEVTFRLYADNSFPVFQKSGMSSLHLGWGLDELRFFERPLFWLFVKKEEDVTEELPSGKTVLSFLETERKEGIHNITDIGIGYELNPDVSLNGEKVIGVKLNPIWYVAYGNTYKKILWDEIKGGELVGLE